MSIFTVEVRESDSNDCIVYDVVVDCDSKEEARNRAFDWAMSVAPKGTEEDGDFGAFYACDAEEEDCECDHGGFTVGEAEFGNTARNYHVTVRLDTIPPSDAEKYWATLNQTNRQAWREKFDFNGEHRTVADLAFAERIVDRVTMSEEEIAALPVDDLRKKRDLWISWGQRVSVIRYIKGNGKVQGLGILPHSIHQPMSFFNEDGSWQREK